MDYSKLLRRKLLEDIYGKMSDEEKRTFMQLSLRNRDHNEIMTALRGQSEQINRVASKVEKQNWSTDFLSDVAANFFTDGLIWLGSQFFKKI